MSKKEGQTETNKVKSYENMISWKLIFPFWWSFTWRFALWFILTSIAINSLVKVFLSGSSIFSLVAFMLVFTLSSLIVFRRIFTKGTFKGYKITIEKNPKLTTEEDK